MKTALKGNRNRKARRQLRRGSNERVTFMDPQEFDELVAELDEAEAKVPHLVLEDEAVIDRYVCPRCGAKNDERCVTPSGKKTDRHAAREVA